MTFTKIKRLLLLWRKGSFKERFPNKCDKCSRRSIFIGDDSLGWSGTYLPCGHKYDLWIELRAKGFGFGRRH